MNTIRKYWEEKPLMLILIVSAFFRLVAVILSKGYGMHDDHFLVIEASQSWVDGEDYNDWLPSETNKGGPTGHSLLYPGFHYFLFSILQFLGLDSPQGKMYIVRLLHAAWSMIIIYLGYKIALRKAGIEAAKMAGLLLGILFFMPFMSVRNLVEFVCIPPLLYATWLVIKKEGSDKVMPYILSGIMLSLAFTIRTQTAFFIFGFGLSLLFLRKWRETLWIVTGSVVGIIVFQLITDVVIWKKPFMELGEYIRYNLVSSGDYPNNRWYTYLLLISGIFIPPISLFLIFGFLKSWKKHLLLFLPAFIFFVFHSYFPSKQERFVLPAMPFIIILGSIGWITFMAQSNFWLNHKKLYRSCWIFFFSLNTIPLIFVSSAYSHRSRVESMVYLSEKKDLKSVLIEESNHNYYTMLPHFYLKSWKDDYFLTAIFTVDSVAEKFRTVPPELIPKYVVFVQPENIEHRVENLKKLFPDLTYEATIEPGFIDKVMHFLNKKNANFTSYIYNTGENLNK